MDREKVVRDLEYLVSFGGASQQSMVMQIATEALVLLKEQEIKGQISDAIHETAKQFRQTIVRCKDCKYRPIQTEPPKTYGFSIEFPEGSKCPCQCDDGFYSWYPADNWFCADGERKSAQD